MVLCLQVLTPRAGERGSRARNAKVLTQLTMSELMPVSQHLSPWGDGTCLALACLGHGRMSWLVQLISYNHQSETSCFFSQEALHFSSAPVMLALHGFFVLLASDDSLSC